jgi:hypothetical protein
MIERVSSREVAEYLQRRLPGESVSDARSRALLERQLKRKEQAERWRVINRNDRRIGWLFRFAATLLALLLVFPKHFHLDAAEITGVTTTFTVAFASCVRSIVAGLAQKS